DAGSACLPIVDKRTFQILAEKEMCACSLIPIRLITAASGRAIEVNDTRYFRRCGTRSHADSPPPVTARGMSSRFTVATQLTPVCCGIFWPLGRQLNGRGLEFSTGLLSLHFRAQRSRGQPRELNFVWDSESAPGQSYGWWGIIRPRPGSRGAGPRRVAHGGR